MNGRSFLEKVNVKVIAKKKKLVDIPGPQLKVVSFLLDLSRNPISICTAHFLGLNILLEYKSLIFISYFTIPSSGESRINLPLQSFFSQAMLSYPASISSLTFKLTVSSPSVSSIQ